MNGEFYALKEIPKLKLIEYKEVYCHVNEPNILKKFENYYFLPKIISSFQDYDNLYIVTNYYSGKTLNYYKDTLMTENQIKFISACIIQSLFYLRKEHIIHRDIRMNNIILDNYNYFNLIDYSYSISYNNKNNFLNYVIGYVYDNAPEIQNRSIYDYNSDYYRLGGSIIYYLMFKKQINKVKKEKNISEIIIDYNNITNYSSASIDFINKLIITDYKKRIGFNSINELKKHYWFKDFNWEEFSKKKLNSPLNFLVNESNKYNESICSKFNFTLKEKLTFKNISEQLLYKNSIKKFDYVNKKIILKILKLIKYTF